MNYRKLTTGVATFSVIAASLVSGTASALSTATMSLTGSSNSNGNFAITIYENTGTDTVAGANVVLDFNVPVTGVSYDYTIGAFPATTPSGDAHDAYGAKTGTQVVAVAHFSLSNPGTVTATVDSSSSFLKNVDTTTGTITNFPLSAGSASFTYTAPAAPSQPAQSSSNSTSGKTTSSTNGTSSSSSTKPSSTGSNSTQPSTPTTNTTQASTTATTSGKTNKPVAKNTRTPARHVAFRHAGLVTSGAGVLVIAAIAFYYWFFMRKTPAKVPAAAVKPSAKKTTRSKATSKK